MTKTSRPRYDFGTGYAITATLNRVRQIVREHGEKLNAAGERPNREVCAAILRQIEEEFE